MKKCTHCGRKLDDQARYCTGCGMLALAPEAGSPVQGGSSMGVTSGPPPLPRDFVRPASVPTVIAAPAMRADEAPSNALAIMSVVMGALGPVKARAKKE